MKWAPKYTVYVASILLIIFAIAGCNPAQQDDGTTDNKAPDFYEEPNDGTFERVQFIEDLGDDLAALAVGDSNKDKYPEIYVLNRPREILVLSQADTLYHASPTAVHTMEFPVVDIALGTISRDEQNQLVVLERQKSETGEKFVVSAYSQIVDAIQFNYGITLPDGEYYEIDIGDLDNDGTNEVAVLGSQGLLILARTSDSFAVERTIGEIRGRFSIGNVAGGSENEVVTSANDGRSLQAWRLSEDNLEMIKEVTYEEPIIDGKIELGDINGDAIEEIFAVDRTGVMRQMFFGAPVEKVLGALKAELLAIKDVDNDGDNDMITIYQNSIDVMMKK